MREGRGRPRLLLGLSHWLRRIERRAGVGGTASWPDLVPLSEIAANPARLENRAKKVPDGAGGLVEQEIKFPIWVDPVASGGTPWSGPYQGPVGGVGLAQRASILLPAGHPESH